MVFFFHTNVAFKSVDIGTAIFKNAPVQFSTRALKRLEEKGVIFARLEDVEGVESYSAVYNGEVLVQSGSASELKSSLKSAWGKTGDDLVRELDRLENFAIQRKVEKRARDFIHKWSQKSTSLINLTIEEMSTAIKGYTTEADKIAEIIDKGRMHPEIWDDEFYIEFLLDYAKKDLNMNDIEALDYAWSTEAFEFRKRTIFKESTNPKRFLTLLVHEGTHALDKTRAEDWLKQGKKIEEIKAKIGNTWDKEDRAFINEWEFQKATNMKLDFKSIEDIKKYVRDFYHEN